MRNAALRFVLIIGIANFFADFTYEGACGIVGPFLGSFAVERRWSFRVEEVVKV
jgi:hypothetical protein